jgi:hypothetical protein
MFKINTATFRGTYNEAEQRNPICWRFMYKEFDGSLTPQAAQMKCKDFFNDAVAAKHNKRFEIYGYNNENLKFNEEGLYVLVKNVKDKSFYSNLLVINERLEKDLGCQMTIWENKHDEAVLLFPNGVLDATYYMSVLALTIRCSNYGYIYKTWEDFWSTNAPTLTQERGLGAPLYEQLKTYGFKKPEGTEKYWWYQSKAINSETPSSLNYGFSSYIHNAGALSWLTNLRNGI